MLNPIFTIVTPCYNSANTLFNTYTSLEKQSIKDFEWILIDDCSDDKGATKDLILKIANTASFPIKHYFFDENHFGSKSLAKGCELAVGDYIGILDHDDQYVPDALEKVKEYIEKYDADDIAGVVGRCIDENGKFIGMPFKKSVKIDFEGVIRYEDGIMDEFVLFSKRSILHKYAIDFKQGYTYGFLWAMISKKYKYIYVNDVFRVYDMSVPTSYTNNRAVNIRFPEAKVEMNLMVFDSYSRYLHLQFLLSLRQAAHTIYLMFKYNIKPNFKIIRSWRVKALLFLAFPLGLLKYLLNK